MSEGRGERAQTLGGIVGGLAADVQELVRGEIALARSEFEQKLNRVALAAAWLLGGALIAFAGVVVFLLGIGHALGLAIALWLALLVVGGTTLIGGVLLSKSGIEMLSATSLVPDRTAESLQKDAHMLKEHT
jgi:hypothetical protein